MSIDRYLYIVHSGWYRRHRTPRHAQVICILIWTGRKRCSSANETPGSLSSVSSVFMFPYEHLLNISMNASNQSSGVTECTVHEDDSHSSSCLLTFVIYYILPLLTIGLCSLRILLHVRRTGHPIVKRMVRFRSVLFRQCEETR